MQRFSQWGVHADGVCFCIGFIGSDYSVRERVAIVVADFDGCAKEYCIIIGVLPNDGKFWQAFLQVADASIQATEFLLAIDVLGVFGTIAFGCCCGKSFDDIAAA